MMSFFHPLFGNVISVGRNRFKNYKTYIRRRRCFEAYYLRPDLTKIRLKTTAEALKIRLPNLTKRVFTTPIQNAGT